MLKDDPRSGTPISSTNDQNVEVVRAVMAEDRRLSVWLKSCTFLFCSVFFVHRHLIYLRFLMALVPVRCTVSSV